MNRHPLQRFSIPLVTLLCALVACSRTTPAPTEIRDQQVTLAAGESATIAGITVRALAIQDSRCPSNASCITAGDVVLILGFSGAGSVRTDTLRLVAAPKASTYGGLLFQPTTVVPYPDIRNTAATSSMVMLSVTRAPSLLIAPDSGTAPWVQKGYSHRSP